MIPRVYKVHPFADTFPMLSDVELEELADDIREHGQREAIVLSFDGSTILDGRNRLAALQLLGLEPKTRKINSRMSEEDVLNLIMSANLHRRHLNPTQKAVIALGFKQEMARLTAERERETRAALVRTQGRQTGGKFAPSDSGSRDPLSGGEHVTREGLAEKFDTSGGTIQRVERVAKHMPELVSDMRAGKLDAATAEKHLLSVRPELKRQNVPKDEFGWLPPHGTPPPANARSSTARQARESWIRWMANDSATSYQIGDKIDLDPNTVRRIAREAGIVIPADVHALRKKQPTFNVGSALDLLVSDLESMSTNIERIRSAATEVDPSKVDEYADALVPYAKGSKQLSRQLAQLIKDMRNGNSEEV